MQATDSARFWNIQLLVVEERHLGRSLREGMAVMIEGGGVERAGWRGRSQPGPLRGTSGQPWWILGERVREDSDQQNITEEIRCCTPRS